MKPGYTIRHVDISSVPNNIQVYNYENNNSIANVYTGMLNENNKAYRADQIGRWKIKYYFDI